MKKFGKEYGIFPSVEETYIWLLRVKKNEQRGRDSIHWIQPYLPILRKYAKKCTHITEFGINQCVSTWAFLAARPEKLVSVDIDLNRRATQKVREFNNVNLWLISAIAQAQRIGIEYSVIQGDTGKIQIEETDLLFIDSLHTEDHLRLELNAHSEKVRKYIIFHDTFMVKKLNIPIKELCATGNFREILRIDNFTGLTVIERI